ncbi:MAG: hypothetical protein E7528_02460 [Ruminococcaceae bacterium]|nr:hypothetical protein [Oscillospiraceae bacterium]
MTKTISELWSGNLDPITRLGMNNIEIEKMEKLMSDNYDKLKAKLNDETKEILEKYYDCVNDYVLLISEQSFCDGFCLGTKISAEALVSAEQLL